MKTFWKPGRTWIARAVALMPVALFVFALVNTWMTADSVSANLLDSDASSELVLAQLLSRQHAILSTDWFYSNELRVVQTNLVFAPLFALFEHWHTVRLMGVMLLQSMLVLSYAYLCKQLRVGVRAFLLSATLLLLPMSISYGRIVLYHTYYLPYITLGFLIVGLYLSVMYGRRNVRRKAGQAARLAALMALCFAACLGGIRLLMVTLSPLVLAAFSRVWQQEKHSETGAPEWSPQEADGDGFVRRATIPHLQAKWRGVLLALLATLAGFAGYWVNQHVLAGLYQFRQYDDTTLGFLSVETLPALVQAYFAQFGYQGQRALLSPEGILSCGAILAGLFLLAQGIGAFASKATQPERCTQGDPDASAPLVLLFFPAALLVMVAVFVFTVGNAQYELYLIPVAVWAIPMLGVLMKRGSHTGAVQSARRVLLSLTCVALLANGLFNNAFFRDPQAKPVQYSGLSMQEVDTAQRMSGVLSFLQENGYTLGYATFWNGNILTELSDGHIAMASIRFDLPEANPAYYNWLTSKQYRDPNFVRAQKVFILLRGDEEEAFYETALYELATPPVYEDETYIVYGFDSSLDPYHALEPSAGTLVE